MPRAEASTGELAADNAVLDAVHAALRALWAAASEVDAGDRALFEIAVAEVAANIVQHGGGAAVVVLDLAADGEVLEARFRDTGAGMEPAVLAAAELPDVDLEAGRGLAMAKAALDELHYERLSDGNQWTLRRIRRA